MLNRILNWKQKQKIKKDETDCTNADLVLPRFNTVETPQFSTVII